MYRIRLFQPFYILLFSLFLLPRLSFAEPASLAPTLAQQVKYPKQKAGAEILHAITHSQLDDAGNWERRNYFSVRINDQEAARDYGRLAISYNHYYNAAELEFANVLSGKGAVKAVSADAIQVRVVGGGQDFYEDRSEIVFSLPDVAPGSIIEFQYVSKTLKRSLTTVDSDGLWAYWFQRRVANDGWRADGVRAFEYRLTLPQDHKPNFKVFGDFNPNAKITTAAGKQTYLWQWRNIASLPIEAGAPPLQTLAPGISMSTSKDWQTVDAWTWANVADKLVVTSDIKKVIKQLKLPTKASREEKIRAVYGYIQHNVRYVFAHLGRGGYEPHFPKEVLRNGYGDCKDQTVLALTLLKALQVEAYPVLVETAGSGKSDTELVSLIFDHMMVWVAPTPTEPSLWLDTTSDRALFPGVSGYLAGQPALIVNGRGGVIQTVDAELAANRLSLSLSYRETNKQHSEVSVSYVPTGVFEQNLRQWWKHDTNRETSARQLLTGIFEDNNQYELAYEVLNTEDLTRPARIDATFSFKEKTEDKPAYATSFAQLFRLVNDIRSMQIPTSRKTPFADPLAIEYRLQALFVGQANTIPTVIQSGDDRVTPFYTLKQSGKTQGQDYVIDIHYQRPALTLSAQEYATYYQELVNLKDAGAWLVSMQSDPATTAATTLTSVAKKYTTNSVEYQIALAKNLLEQGKFDQALEPAKTAVDLQPQNAEAWYILGTAQGFNTLVTESLASFEKAKKLGYIP